VDCSADAAVMPPGCITRRCPPGCGTPVRAQGVGWDGRVVCVAQWCACAVLGGAGARDWNVDDGRVDTRSPCALTAQHGVKSLRARSTSGGVCERLRVSTGRERRHVHRRIRNNIIKKRGEERDTN